MNVLRVKEIIKSADTVDVKHQNRLVWLEDVDVEQNQSRITYLDNQSSTTVDVDQLVESRL